MCGMGWLLLLLACVNGFSNEHELCETLQQFPATMVLIIPLPRET